MDEDTRNTLRRSLIDRMRPDKQDPEYPVDYHVFLREFNHIVSETALLLTGGNKSRAARLLGISRNSLNKWVDSDLAKQATPVDNVYKKM